MQEIGRAGRRGQPASALMFFNNSDISKSRMTEEMIAFCKNNKSCLIQLIKHFGFENVIHTGAPDKCCSNCQRLATSNNN